MNRQQIMQLADSDPRFQQAIAAIERQIGAMPITSEGLQEVIGLLEAALQQPEAYPQILQEAMQRGLVDPGDLPEQFDPVSVIAVLVVLYRLQDKTAAQGFARGGLAYAAERLAGAGRGGDTMLAHINPREAAMLRRAGGSGSINPQTGLPEYGFFKKLFKAILPVAAMFVAPMVGGWIGSTALGSAIGSTASAALGGALTGGAASALGGGNFAQGAVMGALGAGGGEALGSMVAPSLSGATQNMIGSGLIGGLGGAASGQGFAQGALRGAAGAGLGSAVAGLAGDGPGAMSAGVRQGGQTFGHALSAGMSPGEAVASGALSGLAAGLGHTPRRPLQELGQIGQDASPGVRADTGLQEPVGALNQVAGADSGFGLNMKTIGSALPLLSLLGAAQTPQDIAAASQSMSPEQREYFNRASVAWDWDRMKQDAAAQGVGLGAYMAQNWDKVQGGAYNKPAAQQVQMARGGALSNIAYLARGAGTGRSDQIDARLSDGEFVVDAETVAMLGDGSTKAGAEKLEQMRSELRAHKGKALAKGKFSPNAKSPLAYLKEAA